MSHEELFPKRAKVFIFGFIGTKKPKPPFKMQEERPQQWFICSADSWALIGVSHCVPTRARIEFLIEMVKLIDWKQYCDLQRDTPLF